MEKLWITLGHFPPALITPGTRTRKLETTAVPQNFLKLFKLANPKSTFTLPPSSKSYKKGSCPQFPLSFCLLTNPTITCVTAPHPTPMARHSPFSWNLWAEQAVFSGAALSRSVDFTSKSYKTCLKQNAKLLNIFFSTSYHQ